MSELERIDAELARLAREEAALRLRLGQVLQASSAGAYFELGFSSMGAYATERCELGLRWVEGAQCLARRLEALPVLRQSVAFGDVCWSRAELVARIARPDTERQWLELARNRTVRELRALVRHFIDKGGAVAEGEPTAGDEGEGHDATEQETSAEAAAGEPAADLGAPELSVLELEDDACTLTCTVDREQAWLFEATRALLHQLGTPDTDSQIEAMLAEAQGVLLDRLPADAPERQAIEQLDDIEACSREQSERQRAEAAAEACAEQLVRRRTARGAGTATPGGAARSEIAIAAARGGESLKGHGAHELDGLVRELRRALCRHELELSCRVVAFLREGGWRLLGFLTLAHYARERLGMSRSSLLARRMLGSRLEALPDVAEALASGRLGVEAASQVIRIATPSTELAWLQRAERRTIKHLREEVSAALVVRRVSGELDCVPPVESELDAFHELERAVVSGRAWHRAAAEAANDHEVSGGNSAGPANGSSSAGMRDATPPGGAPESVPEGSEPVLEQRRPWRVMLVSLDHWLRAGGVRMSAEGGATARGVASAGRIQLRLRVSRATRAWWRGLESAARGRLPPGMSWFEFACVSVWRAWGHLLGEDVAYGRIYIRDRHRCSSPVCSRRDVTPHHLQFRSAGGSDADHNIVTVCCWCHLLGIHGGRIRARGAAGNIRWELGAGKPCVVVQGRERVAA